ncbi:hypothetical protein K0M31_011734 [Melipona bicolor]|uniref:Uncharacterized protein n=1 Tax=Melipona bicolor TaxID=60889 RepID=A0AA40GA44_9HYME|nr:hypothetical protein K0M31_011734 [Melipona bicolor]
MVIRLAGLQRGNRGRISKLRDVAIATVLESRGNSGDIRIERSDSDDIRSGSTQGEVPVNLARFGNGESIAISRTL